MRGFKAYKYHIALKLHFTRDNYNVFQNRGSTRLKMDTFATRNDSYLFQRLENSYPNDKDLIQYMVSNYAYGNPSFLYDETVAKDNYTKWVKVKESLTRTFTDDISTVFYEAEKQKVVPSQIINCTNIDIPFIIKLYMAKQVQPHTISILNDITGMIDDWMKDSTMLMLFHDDMLRLLKLKGFFSYDKEKLEKIYASNCGDV